MTTKEVVEALLSIDPDLEKIFIAAHVIANPDRNWRAKAHPEFRFLKNFFNSKFIIIISTQIHIYIIGDKAKGNKYHIINLEGYHADYMIINKNELTKIIKDTSKEKLFLPNNFYDRIIYMTHEELFIFNRVSSLNCNMFTNKSKWSVGASTIYDVNIESKYKERNTNAQEILNEIYKECFI